MSVANLISKNHWDLVDEIDKYEKWKASVLSGELRTNDFFLNVIRFLDEYKRKSPICMKNCWGDFVSKCLFVREKAKIASAKYIYVMYPNPDPMRNIMKPDMIKYDKDLPKDGWEVRYDFRQKFIYMNNYDMLMFDYDIENGITREMAIEELYRIVEIGKKYKLNFTFVIMPSDDGLHAFLVSMKCTRNLIWVDMLRNACSDPYYAAFSYSNGYSSRISKKQDKPDGLVTWLTPVFSNDIEDHKDNLEHIIDYDFPSMLIKSEYLGKNIQLKYFDNNLRFIGDPRYAKQDMLNTLQIYYMLVQYFRHFSVSEVEHLECSIYNAAIYPYSSNIYSLQKDIDTISNL